MPVGVPVWLPVILSHTHTLTKSASEAGLTWPLSAIASHRWDASVDAGTRVTQAVQSIALWISTLPEKPGREPCFPCIGAGNWVTEVLFSDVSVLCHESLLDTGWSPWSIASLLNIRFSQWGKHRVCSQCSFAGIDFQTEAYASVTTEVMNVEVSG